MKSITIEKSAITRTDEEIAVVREVYELTFKEHQGHGCKEEALAGQALLVLDWLAGKSNGLDQGVKWMQWLRANESGNKQLSETVKELHE